MNEWQLVRLGAVGTFQRGVSYNGAGLNQPGPMLVGMGQIKPEGGLDLSDVRTYGGKVKPHHYIGTEDVAIVMTDLTQTGELLGSPARAPTELVGNLVVSHHLQRFRCDASLDPQFAEYLLMGPRWRAHVHGMATGTTVRAVSPEDASRFEFHLPPLSEQQAIAGVLGALDDKIESNRRLGDTGVDLARTMLLKGESRARLGDIATCDKGLSYKGDGLVEDSDSGLPMINLGNFAASGWLMPEKLKFYKGEYKDRHLVEPGDVVVANTDLTQQRVIIGRPALVPPALGKAIFTHHVTAVRPVADGSLRLPIWSQLNSPLFRERAEGFATGTTVAGMPVETLLDFEIEVPNRTVIDEAQAVLERVWIAELESSKLALVRDALLPELLSGRLRVKNAEKIVEEAV